MELTKEDIEMIALLYKNNENELLNSIIAILQNLNSIQSEINSMRALGLPNKTNVAFQLSGNAPLPNIIDSVEGDVVTAQWLLIEYLKNIAGKGE